MTIDKPSPSVDALLDLLLVGNRMKLLQRQGWTLRGIPLPESIAEHSHQASLLALLLLDQTDEDLDREQVLTTILIHDLAEAVITDIPYPAIRRLGREAKGHAEEDALQALLGDLPRSSQYLDWWTEFERESSPEGRLVKDADRLEMMIQAFQYEQAGQRGLDEFWEGMARNQWHYPVSAAIFNRLCALREKLGLAGPQPTVETTMSAKRSA